MEALSGWYGVIRGPRPPSVRWSQLGSVVRRKKRTMAFRTVSAPAAQRWATAFIEGGPIKVEGQETRVCVECWDRVRLQGSLAALGPDDIAERRVLEDASAKVRAHCCTSWATFGRVREVLRGAAKRVEKAQEVVAEALKVQTQREEELAEERHFEASRSCSQLSQEPTS